MKISDLFQEKTVFSFEVFPPKKESGVETIYKTLEALKDLNPDFISVTYGAGGSGVANATTIDLCSKKHRSNFLIVSYYDFLPNSILSLLH